MNAGQDVFSIINALPNAVLIISSKRGKIIGANNIFFEQAGFSRNDLVDTQLINLPFFTKQVKRELLRLFIKALHGKKRGDIYTFPYLLSDQTIKNISASAEGFTLDGQECVLFTFRDHPAHEVLIAGEDSESWRAYLNLAYEPYMEFRPSDPFVFQESEDRIAFLRELGHSLQVKLANDAASKLYCGENGGLNDKTFSSLFNNEEDSLRFLDMLSIVGQMKAETAIKTFNDTTLQVEMNCVVKFCNDGTIAAVYCSQRDLSAPQRYEAIIGGSRLEMDFTFNQPFVGFAFLTPTRPIERPQADNVDEQLDEILNQIIIMRANQAMLNIHNTEKTKFLMKPMIDLFPNSIMARQVMKELFVMRVTSIAVYVPTEDDEEEAVLQYVSVFRATFDDADHLNGIMVSSSKYSDEFKARHSNKTTRITEEDDNNNVRLVTDLRAE